MSSYRTRMISMSDIEEPICPRPPPASPRTTRRRKYFERSSSGGVAAPIPSMSSAVTAIAYSLTQTRQHGASLVQLPGLGFAPIFACTSEDAALPALGHELVKQYEDPPQAEQRQECLQPY